ncbi:MAG: MMPL family transporter, partial [Janthinobacterium lividum]
GRAVTHDVTSQPYASQIQSYFTKPTADLRSTDGRSAVVLAKVDSGPDATPDPGVDELIDRIEGESTGQVLVRVGGQTGANLALTNQIGKDLALVSIVAVPVTVVLLYFVFGGILAAALPLAVTVIAVLGSFATLHLLTEFTPVSTYAIDLTIALGLGLAVDYGLLIVSRFREEAALQDDPYEALARSLATAGRTVLFSGVTVALALTALLVFPVYFLKSFGYAGIAVVVFAVAGALVVLPALIAAAAPRLTAHWARRARGQAQQGDGSPRWRAVASAVTARPALLGLPVAAVLVVVGLPLLHVHFASPDDRALRSSVAAHQVGDALRAGFGDTSDTALTVVTTTPADGQPLSAADLAGYSAALSRQAGVTQVAGPAGTWRAGSLLAGSTRPDPARSATRYDYWTINNRLDPTGSDAAALVRAVRAVPVPPGALGVVGGEAASLVDQKHSITHALPAAIAVLVVATLIMLFLFTGSVLIPLKALVLNALTLFAVLGAMVWVFQGGHLTSLLRFTPTPTSTTIPPLLLVVAFALSVDYEVFLISRIKEFHDDGLPNREAVVDGMARTGGIVTTAAVLLCVTFFAFGLSKIS